MCSSLQAFAYTSFLPTLQCLKESIRTTPNSPQYNVFEVSTIPSITHVTSKYTRYVAVLCYYSTLQPFCSTILPIILNNEHYSINHSPIEDTIIRQTFSTLFSSQTLYSFLSPPVWEVPFLFFVLETDTFCIAKLSNGVFQLHRPVKAECDSHTSITIASH